MCIHSIHTMYVIQYAHIYFTYDCLRNSRICLWVQRIETVATNIQMTAREDHVYAHLFMCVYMQAYAQRMYMQAYAQSHLTTSIRGHQYTYSQVYTTHIHINTTATNVPATSSATRLPARPGGLPCSTAGVPCSSLRP